MISAGRFSLHRRRSSSTGLTVSVSTPPARTEPAADRVLEIARGLNALDVFETAQFGSIADRLADRLGTRGLPITLSTACASGATAIQLGVEAIRRGECDRALSIGADGSVTAEALIRFSLLSALSTQNDVPEKASKPFSRDRDGFVIAEGAAALVLESLESAVARGANVLGILRGCGERADDFHRTRSKPDGSPAIAAVRSALSDAGLAEDGIGLCQRPRHVDARKRQDGALVAGDGFRRPHAQNSDLLQQVDDRPHSVGSRRSRGRILADDHARGRHSADHQLRQSRPGNRTRRSAECEALLQIFRACCPIPSASAARTLALSWRGNPSKRTR